MVESLRDQQKRVARERLLQATADEIVDNGPANLSLAAVADRAGVSERTLYNYFQTRENLLAQLNEYSAALTEAHGGRRVDTDPERMPATIRTNWASWQAQHNVAKALLLLESAAAVADRRSELRPLDAAGRRERTAAFRAAIESVRPDLDGDQLDAITALVRTMASSRTWLQFVDEHDIPSETAATVTAWAFETVRDALRDGRGPFDPPGR